jgi:hypothetical protein
MVFFAGIAATLAMAQEALPPARLVLRGDNKVWDLRNQPLQGTPVETPPDQRRGVGIEVIGRNVTIKNARVRGFKIGLIAQNAPGIKIIDSDFSYNWKQRLQSTRERENGADWMSYHRNEQNQWLRYGAGIYLRKCDNFEVRNVRIVGGQNGLMIMECNKGLAWNNNFSFLSSVGLGMYLSSDNRFFHNNIDWCVRGYSHGKWNRGQDSTGILIYEQSHRNIFAYNSVTHGGDGFFLWAGQTTMDTGQGGCNDNVLYGNDWSHAPTNGIEATFSRNRFEKNLILECWHGIWGGYSFDSVVKGNTFGYNAEAIAWEHGQDNLAEQNVFLRDRKAFVIWSNPTQDPNWGYPKNRDTRSRDWVIRGNTFENITDGVLTVRRTESVLFENNEVDQAGPMSIAADARVTFRGNRFLVTEQIPLPEGVTRQGGPRVPELPPTMMPSGNVITEPWLSREDYLKQFEIGWSAYSRDGKYPPGLAPLKGGKNPFLKPGTLRGRRYMLIDEWGPYDFKSPRLWLRSEGGNDPNRLTFEVLGPRGKWRVVRTEGGRVNGPQEGSTGAMVEFLRTPGATVLDIQLEYTGEATTDYRGIVTPAGRAVPFGYRDANIPIEWDVKFFRWSDRAEPENPRSIPLESHFQAVIKGEPVRTEKTRRLDYGTGVRGVGSRNYLTVAEGVLTVAPGEYVIEITADDGMRAWLDGKPLIEDAWKYQAPTLYSREVRLSGRHTLRIEHFQIDGAAALTFNIRPKD